MGRALQATVLWLPVCAVATLPFGVSVALLVGAPIAMVGLATLWTRAARVAVEFIGDNLVVRNLYWTYYIPRQRVNAFPVTTVAGQWQVLAVAYTSMGAYARLKGGLPLDGTMTFQAEVRNENRHVLSAWLRRAQSALA